MIAHKELSRHENSSVKLTVTINREDVKKEYDSLLSEYSRTVQIKGFRKGKVPPSILELKFGEGLRDEAAHNLMEKALKEAFETIEEKPLPYSVPELQDEPALDLENDYTFTVSYDVFPEIKLGAYTGLEVEKPQVAVTDEDMDRELKGIQEQNSVVIEKEDGAVANGDIVTIDYLELDETGIEKQDTAREGFVFTIGTGYNLYKIDDELLGMKKGEEKTIEKEYPAEFETAELAGRKVSLKVKLTAVKEKKLPEINDELAQDVSEKYETLDDLKADIRKRLEDAAANGVRDKMVNALLDKIAETTEVEIPASMVELELESSWRNFVNRFRAEENQILALLEAQGKTREDLYNEWRPDVMKNLKVRLAVEKIIETEKIEVTDEELEKEFAKEAEENKMTLDQLKEYYTKNRLTDYFRDDLRRKKLYDHLIAQAKVKKGPSVKFLDLVQGNQ